MFFSSPVRRLLHDPGPRHGVAAAGRPPRHGPGRHLHPHPGGVQLHHAEGRVRPGAGRAQERQALGVAHAGPRARSSWATRSTSGSTCPTTRPPTRPTPPTARSSTSCRASTASTCSSAWSPWSSCSVRMRGPAGDPGELAVVPGRQLLLALRRRRLGRPLQLPVPAQVTIETSRRSVTSRLAAPAALVGAVAVVGLRRLLVAARPGRHRPTTTGRRRPLRRRLVGQRRRRTTAARSPGAQPGTRRSRRRRRLALPSADGRRQRPARRPTQTGITYTDLPGVLHRARAGALRGQLLELPRHRGQRHRPGVAPEPAGPRRRHRRLLGVHRPHAAGQHQRPGHPQAAPLQPAPGARDRRLGAVARPRARAPRSRSSSTGRRRPRDGHTLFALNCAACHTITGRRRRPGRGHLRPEPRTWPPPTQVVEAIRTGPGQHAPLHRATSPTPRCATSSPT